MPRWDCRSAGAPNRPGVIGFLSDIVFGIERLNLAVAALPIRFDIVPLALIPVTRRLCNEHIARLAVAVRAEFAIRRRSRV